MSTDSLDMFFANLGLLELSKIKEAQINAENIAKEISLLLNNESLPDFCYLELDKILSKHPDKTTISQYFKK